MLYLNIERALVPPRRPLRSRIFPFKVSPKKCNPAADRKEALAHFVDWPMNSLVKRLSKIMSILTVLITISAWLAISNHCALGAVVPEAKKAPADECPFHARKPAPAKQKESSGLPCCKILRAVPAKNVARPMVHLSHVDLVFAKLIVPAPLRISFHTPTLDTGPPGQTTVTELIESMRAHAPPSFA